MPSSRSRYPSALEVQNWISEYRAEENPGKKKKLLRQICLKLSYLPGQAVRQYSWAPNFEDLYSLGQQILVNAVQTYDPQQCNNFSLWIRKWILKSVAVAAKKEKDWGDLMVLSNQPSEMESFLPAADNLEENICRLQTVRQVRGLAGKLQPEEARLVRYRLMGLEDFEMLEIESWDYRRLKKIEVQAVRNLRRIISH